jgi:DNA-binding GntR family transcriptional regulator
MEATSSGQPVASQRIADVIAERILNGEMPPGTRIKQDGLADELRTSRIPVREALRILESRGLVHLRANAGAWVTHMSLRDLELSYEIRERIEPLLLVESLPHLTDAHLGRMREIQDAIQANQDVEQFLVLDRQFHWTSYVEDAAPHLAGMIERLWDTTQHYRRAYMHLAESQNSWLASTEHELLLAALQSHDPGTAASVLALHIRRTRIALAAHPDLFAEEPPG